MPGMPRPAMKSGAKAAVQKAGGRLASARSKTKDPACSSAMSAWKTQGMTPMVAKVLGRCRAMAAALKQGGLHRIAGNEAKAQHLEHRVRSGAPVTKADRAARLKELLGQRSAKRAAAAPAAKPANTDKTGRLIAPTRSDVDMARAERANGGKFTLANDTRRSAHFGNNSGRTGSLFDMKRGDKPGQTSLMDRVASVPTRPDLKAQAAAHRQSKGTPAERAAALRSRVQKAALGAAGYRREALARRAEKVGGKAVAAGAKPEPARRIVKFKSKATQIHKEHAYAVEEGHRAALKANSRAAKSDAEVAVDRSHVERARMKLKALHKAMRDKGEPVPKVAPVAVEGKVVGGKAKVAVKAPARPSLAEITAKAKAESNARMAAKAATAPPAPRPRSVPLTQGNTRRRREEDRALAAKYPTGEANPVLTPRETPRASRVADLKSRLQQRARKLASPATEGQRAAKAAAEGRLGRLGRLAEHPPTVASPRPPGAAKPRTRPNSDLAPEQRAAINEQIRAKNPFIKDMARQRAHGVVERARARLTLARVASHAPKAAPAPASKPAAAPTAAPPASASRKPAPGRGTEDRLNHAAALRVERAFHGQQGERDNFVAIADIRKRLGGARERQDAILRRAQRARAFNAEVHEGLHNPGAERLAHIKSGTLPQGREGAKPFAYFQRSGDAPIAPARGTGKGKRKDRRRA